VTLWPSCFFKSVLAMTKGTVFIPDTSVTLPLTTRLRVHHLRSDAEPVQSEFTVFVSPAGWEAGDNDVTDAQPSFYGVRGSILRRVAVNVPLPAKTTCPPRFTN